MPESSLSPDHYFQKPDGLSASDNSRPHSELMKSKALSKNDLSRLLKGDNLNISGEEFFVNYELSWLKFNRRVLSEAEDTENPLLERVKFIGIVCSNLDEFYQKRVGGLKRQYHAGVTEPSVDGKTPLEQLRLIRSDVKKMIRAYRNCYFDDLLPALEKEGIRIICYKNLNKEQKQTADAYFHDMLYPIITPLAVDEAHPFPFISNKSRSLAVKLKHPSSGDTRFARIKIPSNRPRWIEVSRDGDQLGLLSISELITHKIGDFFPGMKVESANIFRVTRNADLERNEEEADDLIELIEEELRERRFAEIVRLEVDHEMPADVKNYLYEQLDVDKSDVFEMNGPLGLADAVQLYDIEGYQHLRFQPWTPSLHPAFRHEIDQDAPSIFSVIRKGDFMLHHPYHSFESSTQRFVAEAARDPRVLAIKQTLYRTSSDSPIMHSMIRAAEEGKQVAVLVELKARFDEERNITWANRLEKAGVHVSYGIAGLKIHTKLTIVVREEKDGLKRYVHIGTGNYHPDTAQLYEDLGYFTCRKDIASDVTDVFNLLTGYAPDQSYNRLHVAPRHLRRSVMEMINREIDEAKKGGEGHIVAKMNNLEDPLIIQKLYEASNAGVKIDLIARSVCRLIPGKKGMSENIRVHAIVGRFLEHSRCYYFRHGGDDLYFIGSADWMHRNLDARVEVLAPVESPELKRYLQFILNLAMRDNQQRWTMTPKGNYKRVKRKKDEEPVAIHDELMVHAKEAKDPVPRSIAE